MSNQPESEEVPNIVNLLGESHQQTKIALRKAKDVLSSKQQEMEILERNAHQKRDELQITQQKIRTLTEQLYKLVGKNKELETYRTKLLTEAGEVEYQLEEIRIKIRKIQALGEALGVKQDKYITEVKAVEGDSENDPKIRALQEDIAILREKKKTLDEGDTLAHLIANGRALETAEAQKTSIQMAISERWVLINDLESELTELKDTNKNNEKAFAEQKAKQDAELDDLRKQLQELESEEMQLQSMVSKPDTIGQGYISEYDDGMDSDGDMDFLLVEEPQLEKP